MLIGLPNIDSVTKLELGIKKHNSLPMLPTTIPSICDPFRPLLDKVCTVQMHSPNFAAFMLSTDGYQKVLVTSISADSIEIKDIKSVVILNKRDIAGIVEASSNHMPPTLREVGKKWSGSNHYSIAY